MLTQKKKKRKSGSIRGALRCGSIVLGSPACPGAAQAVYYHWSIRSAIHRPYSRIHVINPRKIVAPLHLGSHAPPPASASRRSRPHDGVFEIGPKLSMHLWIRMLAIRFRVPDSRVSSLSATDLPGPASHSLLRLCRRKLHRCPCWLVQLHLAF